MTTSTAVVHGQHVVLSGRLDAQGAAVARTTLHQAMLDGVGDLVVDMSGVRSVDAVGLAVLVGARRLAYRHGRTLLLDGCTPRVTGLLRTTRLHRTLVRQGDAG